MINTKTTFSAAKLTRVILIWMLIKTWLSYNVIFNYDIIIFTSIFDFRLNKERSLRRNATYWKSKLKNDPQNVFPVKGCYAIQLNYFHCRSWYAFAVWCPFVLLVKFWINITKLVVTSKRYKWMGQDTFYIFVYYLIMSHIIIALIIVTWYSNLPLIFLKLFISLLPTLFKGFFSNAIIKKVVQFLFRIRRLNSRIHLFMFS